MKSSSLSVLAMAAFLAVAAPARADEPHTAPVGRTDDLRAFVPGAAALEGKILAPCCWTQTVDIHGSEVANEIRREIRKRLRAGENPDAIQASLVSRYGSKILAIQSDSPLASIALTVLVAIGAVGVAGFFMLKRWRVAGTAAPANPKPKRDGGDDARLDARLDAELRALDE